MKKAFVRAIAAFAVIAMVITISNMLDYILVDDTGSYTRLMEHEFYNQENIDILCLGPSHCYEGIIPSVVSEGTGKDVFNAASSLQSPDVSLALIKEANKLYDLEEVYLEISGATAQRAENYKDRTDLTSIYIVSDYMRPSLAKARLLLESSRGEYYINGFFPARRYWSSILDFQYIDMLVKKKSTEIYRNYGYDYAKTENEWYAGNGYVASNISVDEHGYYTTNGFYPVEIDKISEDWKESVDSIIRYCNHNDIRLTLYDSPISCFQLASQGNYDEYVSFIREFIKNKNVEYAEFNLLREDYLPYRQSNYKDGHHLNVYGANDFSLFLSKYINGEIPETAFYDSISEKLEDIAPDYYGITYRDNAERNTRHIRLISNIRDGFEYKVEVSKSDDSVVLIQDYSTNNEIDIPTDLLAGSDSGFVPRIIISYRYGDIAGVEEYY